MTGDKNIVSLSKSGGYCVINAVGGGKTTVVGTTKDGSNKKVTIKVSVEPKMSLQYVDIRSYEVWGLRYYVYKFKNISQTRTVDGLTIKYWAEDVYHNKLKNFGFGEYEVEETLNVTIKPGETRKTEKIYPSGFNDAKYVHFDLVKVHYTDGTTITNHTNDFNMYFTW